MTQEEITTLLEAFVDDFYWTTYVPNSRTPPPDRKKWVKAKVQLFKRNNPNLFGYVYCESTGDWVLNKKDIIQNIVNNEGDHSRTIDRTGRWKGKN